MSRPEGYICRDFGRPLCCSIPDPRYTMRFDEIGEKPIYWCTYCGKQAQAMDALITRAFAEQLRAAIENAERTQDAEG